VGKEILQTVKIIDPLFVTKASRTVAAYGEMKGFVRDCPSGNKALFAQSYLSKTLAD
jgi:hypothetical protein